MVAITAMQQFTGGIRDLTDDPDHHEAAVTLLALLKGEASPQETAKIIVLKIYGVSIKRTNEPTWPLQDDKLVEFWRYHMCSAIRYFGSEAVQERRLLDLLDEISKQPCITSWDESIPEHADPQVYWHSLWHWSFYFRRSLDFKHPLAYCNSDGSDSDGSDFLAQGPGYLSATRFAAALLERGRSAHVHLNTASGVLWSALERIYDEIGEPVSLLERQMVIPAAVIWIVVAGKTIYGSCVEEKNSEEIDLLTLSEDRWADWKVRFLELAADQSISDQCREWSSQAVSKMTKIEADFTD